MTTHAIPCIDPRTGETVDHVHTTDLDRIAATVAACRAAQELWFDRTLSERKSAVRNLHQAFLSSADGIADILAEECGRPAGEAWTAEIVANHDLFSWWLSRIDDLLMATPVELSPINYPRKRGAVHLQPKGVLGLITPWNLPVAIPLRTIVPAILSGNGIIWKPSEHTPKTAQMLDALFNEHLEPGLVQCIIGGGEHGAAIVSTGIDGVCFTGSVHTGRKVALAAASAGISASLELGGKDAAVVLEDADIKRAAQGISWAAFAFAGQNCAAVERCYVHQNVYDAFLNAVIQHTETLKLGSDIGPLVTKQQLEIVDHHVSEAIEGGACVHTGGHATNRGYYYPPTVLSNVPSNAKVLTEETFGPVLPIVPFSDLADLPDLVNGTAFGLTTSVWTSDLEMGEAIAENFDCGVVTVNNHSFTGALPSAAWGGTKNTGHGITNSRFALYEMTRPKTVVVDGSKQPEMWWFPHNSALMDVTRGLVELSRSGGNRLPAMSQTLKGLLRRWKESS